MSEPFLAEVRMVGFNFPPRGWAYCDGQILPINQNQSLYSLLGTTYGGDGRTSFALPDMRGRTPIHVGNGHTEGQKSGEETHTLSIPEMPNHDHAMNATNASDNLEDQPEGKVFAQASDNLYASFGTSVQLNNQSVANAGSGQAHNNMQPCLAIRFCIALQGLFPSRN